MISGSRRSIEAGLKEKIYEHCQTLQTLDKFFTSKELNFTSQNKETESSENLYQHVVLCNDVTGLIVYVVAKRTINQESMLILIGMDGGPPLVVVDL